MKKLIVVMLALFLAAPVLSYAGSATSRYDVTIGGAINFDFGYHPKSGANDSFFNAYPDAVTGRSNLYTDTGSWYMSVADSNFNFKVKGPDAWGAKTSAFMQVNFRGTSSGNQFGGAQLHIAHIQLDWTNAQLLLGKSFQQWGELYGRTFIIPSDFGTFMSGGTLPTQIAYRYKWTKNFNTMIGVVQATDWQGTPNGAGPGNPTRSNNDSYGRNGLPMLQGEIAWETDACGKVGPHGLKFGLGGILGQEKKTQTMAAVAGINKIYDDTAPVWTTVLRGLVPIIPEKKGNKANAMYFTGNAFIGQNMAGNNWLGIPGFYSASPSIGSYWRPDGSVTSAGAKFTKTASAPTFFGGMLQLTYYLQDNTFVSAQYGYLKWNYSQFGRNGNYDYAAAPTAAGEYNFAGPKNVNMIRQYGLSIFHDPSPNFRLAFEWMRVFTAYNGYANYAAGSTAWSPGTGTAQFAPNGTADVYKVGCIYFF